MAAPGHHTGTPLTPLRPTEASSHTTVGVDARPPEQEQANIKQENRAIIRKTPPFLSILLACRQRKGDNGSVICFIYSYCWLSIYYSIASPVSFKWHPSSTSEKK